MLILSKKTKAGNQIIPTYNYSFAHRKKNEYVDRKKGPLVPSVYYLAFLRADLLDAAALLPFLFHVSSISRSEHLFFMVTKSENESSSFRKFCMSL